MRLDPRLPVLLTVALMLIAVSSAPVSAAETPAAAPPAAIELSKEAFKLYSQHPFAEAEVAAKRSLELLEAALPPDDIHLGVARSPRTGYGSVVLFWRLGITSTCADPWWS